MPIQDLSESRMAKCSTSERDPFDSNEFFVERSATLLHRRLMAALGLALQKNCRVAGTRTALAIVTDILPAPAKHNMAAEPR